MTPEGRYQVECRALRTSAERSIGALLEAKKACLEEHTRAAIDRAIEEMRATLGIDFSCPEARRRYRVPGGNFERRC